VLDPATCWPVHYDLTHRLLSILCDVSLYVGKLEQSFAIVNEVLNEARSFEDKLSAYRSLVLGLFQSEENEKQYRPISMSWESSEFIIQATLRRSILSCVSSA
jgi:hypothetical protein